MFLELDRKVQHVRSIVGAQRSVIALLLPPTLFGCFYFGWNAVFVVVSSVIACTMAGILLRILEGKSYNLYHPSSIITGLLISLTMSANTPLYMILVGALVAEFVGRLVIPMIGRNILNPALFGRGAVALLEEYDPIPYDMPDIVSSASALFKTGGGHAQPEFLDIFLGFTKGSIGETSAIILLICGFVMLRYVAVKREAAIAMIIMTPIAVILMPPSVEIIGHAPWVDNPINYVFGGSTLMLAFFFATDPVTSPQTRAGGLFFGAGVAFIGVAGKFYTEIPGCDMYGILIMNLLTPVIDRVFKRTGRGASSPVASVGSFFDRATEVIENIKVEAGHTGSFDKDSNFETFGKILKDSTQKQQVLDIIAESGLKGCGGGAFPVAKKWEMFQAAPSGQRYLLANGLEGEPETFKDYYLMVNNPRNLVEGAAITAHVLDVTDVVLVINSGYQDCIDLVNQAIKAFDAEYGERVSFTIKVHKGPEPDLYVCGEETALIQFLQGGRGEPQLRPPFPVNEGLNGKPTLIQNVETLSWVPVLVADINRRDHKLVAIGGAVENPGVYEVAYGTALREIVDLVTPVGKIQAILLGGTCGSYLPAANLDIPFRQDALAKEGLAVGTGSIKVFNEDDNLLEDLERDMRFLCSESCGRCTPCRVGTQMLVEIADDLKLGKKDEDRINTLVNTMKDTSSCGLGVVASNPLVSYLKYFGDK